MSRLPSILLLTDSDVFAGTERHILELAAGLAGLGHPVRIGCPVPADLAMAAGEKAIPVVEIPKGRNPDFSAIRCLRRLLCTGEVNVIHAHNGRTALSAAIAVSLARRGAAVTTQHFISPNHSQRRGPKRFVSHFIHSAMNRRIKGHIAISHAVAAEALKRKELAYGDVTVIHNGISDIASHIPDIRSTLRAKLSLLPDQPLILCPARLEPEKDIGTLIDAMRILRDRQPGAVCVIAGDGGLRDALSCHIREASLEEAVRLLGFRNDILPLMRAADIVILPSRAEPFGLVLLEAMALSKPAIATRAGGPAEIIEHPATGLLVPPGDAASMAHALALLLRDSDLRSRIGAAARARFLASFTAEAMARRTSALYQRILSKHHVGILHDAAPTVA